MKKLTTLIALLLVFALVFGACGNKNNASSSATGSSSASSSASASQESKKLKVALIVNQKFGDNGPMDDCAKGLDRAAADFGVEVKKLESASAANFEEDIRAMAKAGYDLIITTFGYMTDATKTIAAEYPDTMFSAIFQFINVDSAKVANIWDTEFSGEGAFYLGGYMAGKTTKTGRVGIIIGAEEPTPNAEGNGFMRGVKAANPNATVDFAFVGSYEDPAKAKEIANAMIANGCDILQTDSGASNAGVVEAAKEAKVLVSGEITDFYDVYNGFYGIIGIGFGETVYQSIQMAVEGKFPGGEHGVRGISNGGYYMDWASFERFAAANTDFGKALGAAITEAKDMEKKLVDGSLKVEFDSAVPSWDRIKAEK